VKPATTVSISPFETSSRQLPCVQKSLARTFFSLIGLFPEQDEIFPYLLNGLRVQPGADRESASSRSSLSIAASAHV